MKEKKATTALRHWLLMTFKNKKAYILSPDSEKGRKCGILKKPKRQAYW